MLDHIDKDRFYEISELILMDINEDLIVKCPIQRMSGRGYVWGLDLLAQMGDRSAIDELCFIEKAYSFKKLKKGNV